MSYYFELGGCSIAICAGIEFSQSYESINGTMLFRTQSGKAVKQTHFIKLKTVLQGKGWMPTGLDSLDYSNPLLLKCAVPLSLGSKSNKILLPVNRRNDVGYATKGYGLVDGNLIESKLIIEDDFAILARLNHAASYQIQYYPELLVYAEPPQVHGNITSAEFSWSLTCEEV